jgi:putative ABC transport system ATP-binding protein
VRGPRLSARGLVLELAGRRVLDGVDLEAWPGEVLAVAGPSGSGKSTLLAVLAGLVAPDAGTVAYADGDERPALVLQGLALVPVLTAAENVEVPLQVSEPPLGRDEVLDRAGEALVRVGLGDRGASLVEHLSGGQRQRVAIARALVVRPGVLLVDEPTSALDAASRTLVLSALRHEASRGAAVVVATHDAEVLSLATRQVDLADGRLG